MAVFTGSPAGSTQFNQQTGVLQGGASGLEVFAALHVARFSYTHASGAGTGEVNLLVLPPGPLIIFPDLCRIVSSDWATAGATFDIGHRAAVTPAGVAIVAVTQAFLAAAAVGGGIIDSAWLLPADGDFDINNVGALTIFGTVAGGDAIDADTVRGFCVWAGGAQG